jgi:uncharacterized membrane protein HdeD (DUF308 family)
MDGSTVGKVGIRVPWWLYLVTGAAWFIVAWIVLRFDLRSVAAISVMAGIVILAAGLAELFNAFAAPGWRWLHGILGAVFVITGLIAFFRPGGTFAMLAAFIGWYLLFKGMLDIILAFATKDVNDAWWLGLVVGVVEVGLAADRVRRRDRAHPRHHRHRARVPAAQRRARVPGAAYAHDAHAHRSARVTACAFRSRNASVRTPASGPGNTGEARPTTRSDQ